MPSRLRRYLATLGPGLVTGAADDDPSGISTYSIVGASFGYLPLWTALFSFPLMAGVQLMCARLGVVSGRGLAAVIRLHYPRWVLWTSCVLLLVANVMNIGADLAGMGAALSLLTGVPEPVWTPLVCAGLLAALIFESYRAIARIFKWLSLALFAYVATAFVGQVDWPAALHATFVPRVQWTREFFASFIAILGTTISPYLFFWQASQEVEEERAMGRNLAKRRGATAEELRACRTDVVTGMAASNVFMFFIILTAAAGLYAHGVRSITTAAEAAKALEPLAGRAATWLFALGLIGTGALAVPVLAASCAYALADAFAWRGSLSDRPHQARKFYTVIACTLVGGLLVDVARVNIMRLLFLTAVLNGLLAPPLIAVVVLATGNARIMGRAVNSRLLTAIGWLTCALMTLAAFGLFL